VPVLRSELPFRAVGALGAALIGAFHATWRVTDHDPDRLCSLACEGRTQAVIAFWHRHILTMLAHHRGANVCVPVSEHRDGEYVAHVMDRYGLQSVRGSSTSGGVRLLTALMHRIEQGWSVAVTPDGPRGPRYSVQPGFALLAKRSGLPVLPVGVAVDRAKVFASWDAFLLPYPFARIVIAVGAPLDPADFADTRALCPALAAAMAQATRQAERLLHAPS
jgi:lysophospholipid acyltransferase (LPLAT)-like uncharacterized protein